MLSSEWLTWQSDVTLEPLPTETRRVSILTIASGQAAIASLGNCPGATRYYLAYTLRKVC